MIDSKALKVRFVSREKHWSPPVPDLHAIVALASFDKDLLPLRATGARNSFGSRRIKINQF